MALRTRENPNTGIIEVFVNDEWIDFDSYRKKQVDDAYQTSVKFLRDRLGEDSTEQLARTSTGDSSAGQMQSKD